MSPNYQWHYCDEDHEISRICDSCGSAAPLTRMHALDDEPSSKQYFCELCNLHAYKTVPYLHKAGMVTPAMLAQTAHYIISQVMPADYRTLSEAFKTLEARHARVCHTHTKTKHVLRALDLLVAASLDRENDAFEGKLSELFRAWKSLKADPYYEEIKG